MHRNAEGSPLLSLPRNFIRGWYVLSVTRKSLSGSDKVDLVQCTGSQ